jgi:hypothetical protein
MREINSHLHIWHWKIRLTNSDIHRKKVDIASDKWGSGMRGKDFGTSIPLEPFDFATGTSTICFAVPLEDGIDA